MPPWIFIILILIIVMTLLIYLGNKDTQKIGDQSAEMLRELENRYENFVERKLLLASNEEALDLNVDQVTEEAFIILKPSFDSLVNHINANNSFTDVKVQFDARVFKSAAPAMEAYFVKSKSNQGKTLTIEDETRFKKTFEDAIKADLHQRKLELKAGF